MKSFTGDANCPNQKYIVYWDMVNLYGKAMQSLLPVNNFKFLEKGKLSKGIAFVFFKHFYF